MGQAGNHRPFTAKPRVPSRAAPCELCVGLRGVRKCFRRVLPLFPVAILSRRPGFYTGLADVEVVGCEVVPRQVYYQIPIFFSFCHCLPIDIPHSSSYSFYQDVKRINL